MADYRQQARQAAERYGLDPNIFERQINQESGFNPTARSGAGALGIAQIMPGTAKGWGVDPLNPTAALNAAAKNMALYVKKYGGYKNALVAYNAGPGRVGQALPAETQAYIKTILGGSNPTGLASPAGGSGTTSFAAAGPSGSGQQAAPSPLLDAGQGGDFTGLLGQLLGGQQQQAPQSMAVAPPSFAAHAPTPQGFQAATPELGQAPAQSDRVGGALGLLDSLRGTDPASAAPSAADATGAPQDTIVGTVMKERAAAKKAGTLGIVPLGGMKNTGKGSFEISGPDPGRLQKGLVSYANKVAAILGQPIVGLDGSTHSKYTVNGNVSEHYTGAASDVFTLGGIKYGDAGWQQELIRAGRAALIAAGMPRKKALQQTGGLFNVGNHQVIFNVNGKQYGGNHLDHLHISTHAT